MAETKDCELVQVMGRRWDTSRPAFFAAPAGLNLEDIVLQSIESAYRDKLYNKAQRRVLLKYARVRLNGVEKDRKFWKLIFPQKGDRIEILHGVRGGGGGGGKNPIATVLSVIVAMVAMVASIFVPPAGVTMWGVLISQGVLQAGIGLLAMGTMMAINALFPAKPPSVGGLGNTSAEKSSPTYSITGGRNAHNVDGYVPLVLGKHRQTPPLGAKSWTSWHGDDQYFNMLVVWGHEHVEVSDFKIGDTALSKYADVTHHFIQSTTGKGLKYFGKQYNEETVGATVKKEDGWIVRTVGEANELSIDITFPGGLTTINKSNGNKESRSVNLEIQYRPTAGGSWKGFAVKTELKFSETKLTWSLSDINNLVSVFYKDGKLSAVPRGQTVSGGIQIFPQSGFQYIYGCGVSVEPSGSSLKVTVGPGVFKKNNKVYSVGGGKTSTYGYWDDVYGYQTSTQVTGKNTVLTIDSPIVIGVNSSGKVVKSAGVAKLYPTKASGVSGGGVTWSKASQSYYNYNDVDEWGYPRSSTYYTEWQATVKSGSCSVNASGKATIRAAVQKQVVRSYLQSGLTLKSWDVRVRRTTADTNDSYIIDEFQWSTMRAIIDKPAFDTPVPICVSELRIRASEQLSGYVSDFSGLCWSKIPDWTPQTTQKVNGKTVTVPGHWNTWRTTSNPASIMRYLLTSRHSLIKPFPAKRLDNDALVKLWNWCRKNGYQFDFIADSEENLWARLIQVLSPAMAGPTTDVDGLWGAIIDSPDKSIRQLFTPRNSWGMSIQRGFARLPDALRVKFIDETDGYAQKEGFVYNDGFNKDGSGGKKKANDVVEWAFEGVTNWNRMYKLARYHLAQMLHRQMTVTINTDWEWLAVHRGDLVGLASDVLMNVFGTARVMRKAYAVSGKVDGAGNAYIYEDDTRYIDKDAAIELFGPSESVPEGAALVGIEIDDTVYYTSPKPARYGIAVRSGTGKVNILEIKPEYGEENSVLYFADVSAARKNPPAFGDLVSISLLGEEYEEYLVASITPGENMSAQITLVPYKAKEIYAAAAKPIPAYEAPVILDQVKGAADVPAPSITSVVSDERVAKLTASGAVSVCIGVAFKIPNTRENTSGWMVHVSATNASTNAVASGSAAISETYVVAENVKEGQDYYVKIRLSDPTTGRYSAWSTAVTHKVTGLVAPPPTPQNVRAATLYPQGIVLTWDEVQVIDLRRYKVAGSTTGQTRGKETEYVYSPKNQTGKLTYSVYSVDTTNHVSTKAGTASLTINPPKKPVVTLARLENEGVVVTYQDAYATWPVTTYEWTCGSKTATSTSLRAVVAPTAPVNALKVKGRARDYFLNWGDWCAETAVTLEPPLTPEVTAAASELGTLAFSWQNCQTVTNIAKYVVAVYVSSAPITSLATATPVKRTSSNSLFYTVDMTKLRDDNGDNNFYVYLVVRAVDKWGLESGDGSAGIYVQPPHQPVVTIEKRIDGLYLTWQDCKRVFNIKKYVVWDDGIGKGGTTYDIDGTSHPLMPRKAKGEPYTFSVQAIDVAGLWSAKAVVTFTVSGVSAIHGPDYSDPDEPYTLTARIDGSDILLEWEEPESTWPISAYQIYNTASVSIGTADTLFFRFPAPVAGAYEYSVRARDLADNWSPEGRAVGITVNRPVKPAFKEDGGIILNGEGLTASWKAVAGENTLPVVAWDVVHWYEYDPDGDGTASEVQVDHGRMDVDTITIPANSTGILGGDAVPAFPVGTHYIHVRAVDTAGNTSAEFAEASIEILPPGKVRFDNCSVVDNNVMLYWSAPDEIRFPIEYYLLEEVDENGDGMEIGRIDALFAATFEVESGLYRYGITPVDVAGNRGERNVIAMRVSQPPDFILYHNWDSLFSGGNPDSIGREQVNGGRVNFVLDGDGGMVGPYADSTWNENLAAIASEKGVNAEDVTWSQRAEWGWERWLDPAVASATYCEIVDVTGHDGVYIPLTTINVTVDSTTLAGSPEISVVIETSQDGETWLEAAGEGFMAFAGEFRFVKYTFTLTGGAVRINGINYKLDVKRKMDFGQKISYAADTVVDGVLHKANGDNYTSDTDTPMEKGTWVDFNVDFADVESLPKPNVVNHPEYTAYTVFVDDIHPQGFRVFVLDSNGNRVTATVDWTAFGV